MTLYPDASAPIKRYVAEAGSDAVAELIEGARRSHCALSIARGENCGILDPASVMSADDSSETFH